MDGAADRPGADQAGGRERLRPGAGDPGADGEAGGADVLGLDAEHGPGGVGGRIGGRAGREPLAAQAGAPDRLLWFAGGHRGIVGPRRPVGAYLAGITTCEQGGAGCEASPVFLTGWLFSSSRSTVIRDFLTSTSA